MPAKKTLKKAAPRKSAPRKSAAADEPQLFHAIGALLNTMHCIAQHEDELCTLLHAAKSGSVGNADLHTELRELLDKMPAHEYTDDLDALRSHLPVPSLPGDSH